MESNVREIVILVGFPGSGKTTIAKKICENEKYIHVEGDVYKTPFNMIKKALEYSASEKSIVFDATNGTITKRKEYVDFAKKYNYSVRCIHLCCPYEIAYSQNMKREDGAIVPKIAYHLYSKMFEEPTEEEGFTLVVI
jgi:bifunctional polynucleotide phosphatase/kinase